MSTTQLNTIFALGEIGLLLLVVVFALVARWASKRETAREIAALPVYQPKLHGMEGSVTRQTSQFAAMNADSATIQTVQQVDTEFEQERTQAVTV